MKIYELVYELIDSRPFPFLYKLINLKMKYKKNKYAEFKVNDQEICPTTKI